MKTARQTYNGYLKSKGLKEVENGNYFNYVPVKQKFPVLVVAKHITKAGWNDQLPTPLIAGEKVLNLGTPIGHPKGYVLIRRGKRVDVFSKKHFVLPNKK